MNLEVASQNNASNEVTEPVGSVANKSTLLMLLLVAFKEVSSRLVNSQESGRGEAPP